MKKREKLNVYFKLNDKYYLLFKIIQMGDNGIVDLKITDFYENFVIEGAKASENGSISELEMDKTSYVNKAEITYHSDGSFLKKNKDHDKPIYTNPYGTGARWTPSNQIKDFQPILNIQIRRIEIYRKYLTSIQSDSSKNKSYICDCDELFESTGSYLLILFVKNKSYPFCKIGCFYNYSDVISELNSELELCLFIQRHKYPRPKPYYSEVFKHWVTPYAHNSIGFCNKDTSKEEMIEKLGPTMFNPQFYQFLQIMADGEFCYLTEQTLKVIDDIDYLYSEMHFQTKLSKPLFIRIVLKKLGENLNSYNNMPQNKRIKYLYALLLLSN